MNSSLILFAQQGPPKGPPDEAVLAILGAWAGVIIGGSVCVLLIVLTIKILFCLSMAKALNRCSERNRQMSPGLVWLFLIPCLDVIWFFFIVIWVPASLQKELEDRGMDDGGSYGKTLGLTSAILWAVSFVFSCVSALFAPLAICPGVIGLVGMILGIVFWVQVVGYSGKLAKGE